MTHFLSSSSAIAISAVLAGAALIGCTSTDVVEPPAGEANAGKEISLSSKEFALLCFFMENPDTLLTKQEIFSKVWKSETPDDNSILVYMKRLRDKIEDTPSKPVHLTTVWGKGYRFNP